MIEALQPIANVTFESQVKSCIRVQLQNSLYTLDLNDFVVLPNWQVLYHTPKSSFSYWDDEHGSHIFSTKDLPFFVCILYGFDLSFIICSLFQIEYHYLVPTCDPSTLYQSDR